MEYLLIRTIRLLVIETKGILIIGTNTTMKMMESTKIEMSILMKRIMITNGTEPILIQLGLMEERTKKTKRTSKT